MSQAEFKKRLKVLMNKPENQVCSDCPERQPRWASLIVAPPGSPPGSLPFGAFCCLECSGSHRRLGTHISFVRSITLDSWKEKEVLSMESGGNKKVNDIFEAFVQNTVKPTALADGRTRERYIRDKYERRKFFDVNVLQKYYRGEAEESEEEESEEEAPKRVSKKKIQALRSPSDAAMRRAQTRQSRVATSNSSKNVPLSPKAQIEKTKRAQKKKANSTSAPAPAPEPIVDLLDFGTPMKDPGPPPDPPSATPSPNLELFKSMHAPDFSGNGQNDNAISENAVRAAATAAASMQAPQKPSFNNDEILSMFNQPAAPQQVPMGYANGIMPASGMMAMNPQMFAMMQQQQQQQHQQQSQQNMSGFPMSQQQQQANMMAMMQQQQANMMMMQQQQQMNPMMMNQKAAMGGNMQQHLAMMNNLHIGNTGGMSMPQARSHHQGMGDSGNPQQIGIAQRPQAPKQEKSDPFDAFGTL